MLSFGIAGLFLFSYFSGNRIFRRIDTSSQKVCGITLFWAPWGAVAGGLIGLGLDRAGNEKEMEYDLDNPSGVQK